MNSDLSAALWSAGFVAALLSIAELAHARGMDAHVTRKLVHIGVGTWILPTYLLFESRWWPVSGALGFVVFNALSQRWRILRAIESEPGSLGSVLYPLSVALVVMTCWDEPWDAVGAASVLVMGWGDGAAALIGRRWGRHRFRVLGHVRSLEGSFTLAAAAVPAVIVALAVVGGVDPRASVLLCAVLCAVLACGLEVICVRGTDNVLVPLGCAALLGALHGRLWP